MRVIVAAAGTGGHINPGIAIANKIKEKEPKSKIIFIGTARGLENDLVPRAGYELERIEAYGLSKKLTIDNLKKMYQTYHSISKAKKIIKEFRPDVVIGTGGYICGPVCMAAKSLKVPVVLHESNAFPGKAVKMLEKKVDKILVAFDDAKKRLKNSEKVIVTGNPTKIRNLDLTQKQKEGIKKQLGFREEKPFVLVFGGSQGAKAINDTFLTLMEKRLNKDYQILLAAGPRQYDEMKEELENRKINIEMQKEIKIVPYIYNMEEVMNACDLAICRSGAMTITELAIIGKPAIFIPLPNVSNNHQEYNAKVLEEVGAAKIILEKELTAEKLNKQITEIITKEETLQKMASSARKIAISQVEEKIYQEIKKVVKK